MSRAENEHGRECGSVHDVWTGVLCGRKLVNVQFLQSIANSPEDNCVTFFLDRIFLGDLGNWISMDLVVIAQSCTFD